jgi:predicted RecA/RadA family phage recombinase
MAITYATFRFGRPLMIDYTDANNAHSAGDVVVSGNLVQILHADLAQGVQGGAAIGLGVYDLPKSTAVGSGAALSAGVPVCWNATSHTADPDLANGVMMGIVLGSANLQTPFAAVADADTQVRILTLPNIGPVPEKTSTVAAAGTVAANAALVPNDGLVLVTGANATAGVILPASLGGTIYEIKNADAANAILNVYPPTNAAINALAANAAIAMAAKTSARFVFYSATQIYTIPLVPS